MIATSATSQNWREKKKNPVANPPTSQKLEKINKIPGLMRNYFRVRVAVRHKGRRSRVKAVVEKNLVCGGD
jgi:hypothetical protein